MPEALFPLGAKIMHAPEVLGIYILYIIYTRFARFIVIVCYCLLHLTTADDSTWRSLRQIEQSAGLWIPVPGHEAKAN